MSLIKCPECERDVSDKATICINCGYPLNVPQQNAKTQASPHPIKKPIYKKWWFWVLCLIGLSVVSQAISAIGGGLPASAPVDVNNHTMSTVPPPPVPFGIQRIVIAADDRELQALVDVMDTNLALAYPNDPYDRYMIYATEDGIYVYFSMYKLAEYSVRVKNGEVEMSKWDEVRERFLTTRSELQRQALSIDRHDPITIVVLNDADLAANKVLLACAYGEVIFDTVEE